MNPSFIIEPMSIADYDEVIRLWKATEGVGLNESDTRPNIELFLKRNAGMSFVARNEAKKIIGAVLCGTDGRRGYLHHLAVEKSFRQRGVGRGLVESCLKELRKLGIPKCNIFVYADNDEGKKFWEHHGWIIRGDLQVLQKVLANT